jgi:hypothetical protein
MIWHLHFDDNFWEAVYCSKYRHLIQMFITLGPASVVWNTQKPIKNQELQKSTL